MKRKLPKVYKIKLRLFRRFLGKRYLLFILCALLISVFFFVFENKNWVFQESEYIGLQNLDKDDLDKQIQDYFGKSIFLININKLEDILIEQNIEIKQIYAQKNLKNKVVFHIEEKRPVFVYLNLNSVYLFDENGDILRSIVFEDKVELEKREYDIARQLISPNSELIEDRIVASLSEDELASFDFAEYDMRLKEKILEEMEKETQNYFTSLFRDRIVEIEAFDVQLPRIIAWEERIYSQKDKFDPLVFSFLKEAVEKFLLHIEKQPNSIVWDGEVRLIFTLKSDTQIIVSLSREIDTQLEDLKILERNFDYELDSIQLIDLSVDKILIEYK